MFGCLPWMNADSDAEVNVCEGSALWNGELSLTVARFTAWVESALLGDGAWC